MKYIIGRIMWFLLPGCFKREIERVYGALSTFKVTKDMIW